jgi:hypothetical protein
MMFNVNFQKLFILRINVGYLVYKSDKWLYCPSKSPEDIGIAWYLSISSAFRNILSMPHSGVVLDIMTSYTTTRCVISVIIFYIL